MSRDARTPWLLSNCRFARRGRRLAAESSPMFAKLRNLHELWFKFNELSGRLSGMAEDKALELKAEFHVLAEDILEEMINEFGFWVNDHQFEGWWESMSEYLVDDESDGTIRRNFQIIVDARPCVQERLEADIAKSINWVSELEKIGFSYGAVEFLSDWLVTRKMPDSDAEDEQAALKEIKSRGLMREYHDWSVRSGNFEDKVDLEQKYGNEWWQAFLPQIKEMIDDCGPRLYKEWARQYPRMAYNVQMVKDAAERLRSIQGSDNVNAIMSAISLALNTAHNNGLMHEHVGMTNKEMGELSNLPTERWEAQVGSYAARRWLRENCRFATYSTDLAYLRDYLKSGVNPHDFPQFLDEYLEEQGGIPKGYVDEYQYLDDMNPEELDKYKKWLADNDKLAAASGDPLSPSYLHMDYSEIVRPDTWLVHFTDASSEIESEGFQVGHEDMLTLGLTTWFQSKIKHPGWNFAFVAESRDAARAARDKGYGKQAIMFQAAGVKAYHHGDEENQVIFWGQSAKDLVPLRRDGNEWSVEDNRTGRKLFAGDFDAVVAWVIANHAQYRRVTTVTPKPPKPKAASRQGDGNA